MTDLNCHDREGNSLPEDEQLLVQRSRGCYYLDGKRIWVKYKAPRTWIVWSTDGQMRIPGRHISVTHQGQEVFLFHPDTPLGGYRNAQATWDRLLAAPEWAKLAIQAAWPDVAARI